MSHVEIPPESPTMHSCPATDCREGRVVTRRETSTGYRMTSNECVFCGGTGLVTAERYAEHEAWRKTQRGDRSGLD